MDPNLPIGSEYEESAAWNQPNLCSVCDRDYIDSICNEMEAEMLRLKGGLSGTTDEDYAELAEKQEVFKDEIGMCKECWIESKLD